MEEEVIVNEIDVTQKGKSSYYTIKNKGGGSEMTGHHVGEINEGDRIVMQKKPMYSYFTVTKIIERRNCAGEFLNPEDSINSFFRVTIQ